jgi:hypothetical protein
MRRETIYLVTITAAILFLSCICFAQIRTGTIRGIVKDETGAVLPGSTVELTGEKLLGGVRSVATDSSGRFRFPDLLPGTYEITVSMEGFQTIIRGDLIVNVAGTVTVDITLQMSAIEETITVTAESPVVDVTDSGFSTTISSELFENLPMRRFSVFDIAQTSPGVTTSGSRTTNWLSSMGSSTTSNSYLFEGVETSSPENGGPWMWANPDQIQEVSVMQVGAPAEYGNFQGMALNLVSKTGSNEFHGTINFYQQFDWLTGNNTPWAEYPYHRDVYRELTGTFGGYLKKDKIWFFLAGQLIADRATGVGADPAYPAKYTFNTAFQRIDWQINEKNRINVSCDTNWYYNGGTPTEFVPYEATWTEDAWNPLPSASWTSILSDKTFFEIKYSGFWVTLYVRNPEGDTVTPYHYDWGTGLVSGNYWYWGDWPSGSHQIRGTVSHFADDFLKGDHDFKCGVSFYHSWAEWKWGYPSGVLYYDYWGYPYSAYFRNPEEYGGANNRISGFIDDSWTAGDRLTLNLGVRFDHTRGGYPEFNILDSAGNPTGQTTAANMDLVKWDTVSPRLGFAYQLTADRKTVLRGSYGRYYDHMLLQVFYDACPSHAPQYGYWYNWDTGAYDWLFWYQDPVANLGFESNLKNPYTDQFSLGIERELFPDAAITATFIYKKSKDAVGTLNTGGVYELIDYYDEFGGQTMQVYNQTNSTDDNFFLTTNPGDYSTYKAFIITFEKRLSHNWQMNASLTLAKALQFPVGYEDPNDNINSYDVPGSYDREYQFKIAASYFFPYGINVSTYFSHEQGRPFNRTVRVRLNQGGQTIAAEPRGSKRYPNQTFLDLRIEKEIRIWNDHKFKLLIDIWNLFNSDAYRSVVSTLATSSNYLVGTSYDLPRRAQIGIRYVF